MDTKLARTLRVGDLLTGLGSRFRQRIVSIEPEGFLLLDHDDDPADDEQCIADGDCEEAPFSAIEEGSCFWRIARNLKREDLVSLGSSHGEMYTVMAVQVDHRGEVVTLQVQSDETAAVTNDVVYGGTHECFLFETTS